MKYSEMTPEREAYLRIYFRKYHAEWYQRNKERLKPIRKAYAQAHRAESVKRVQKYVKKHKDKVIKYHSEYSRCLAGKWRTLKHSAKKRNFDLTISLGDLERLINGSCHYCGASTKLGLDRVDNNIGYTLSNCVACCPNCNYMKKNLNVDDFLGHITKIYLHNNKN
jgi:hypothetical protein